MASIIQVGGKWRAQVRRRGFPPQTRTFNTKILAEKWARQVEGEIDAGRAGQAAPGHVLLGPLIERYSLEIGAKKPFGRNKESTLRLIGHYLGREPAGQLTPERLVRYITKERKIEGVTASIDLTYLKGVLKVARALWKVGVQPSVVDDAREILKHMGLGERSTERDRRPTADELDRLKKWFARRSETLTPDHLEFILDSAFRPPSEICRLRWQDLNHEDRTIVIRDRKDPRKKLGNHQTVPLLGKTYEIIMRQPREDGQELIFPVNGKSWSSLFPRACAELGIVDLVLYDLRHEAISRLVESGKFSIPEIMLVSGHKDPKQMMRYTQLRARDLHR
ncbi:MAG: site-specific integrase [Ramlibacter sp.]|nr:site-specific integrase [Ramlibacter sp.]